MFSHVAVATHDLALAGRFYDAALLPLGFERRAAEPEAGDAALCWGWPGHPLPRFYVVKSPGETRVLTPPPLTLAFLAPSPQAVKLAYRAGLAEGGAAESEPRACPEQGEGYFAASLRDRDGNRVHLAYRGDIRR